MCIISSVRIERLPFPKRKGMQQDFGLVDLPFPSRVMSLTPIGTLTVRPAGDALSFRVRRGVDVFPSVGDPVLLPAADQLRAIVEGEDDAGGRIRVGHCPTAGRAPVHVAPDKLFGRHLAVLGNTGAGKSCSVAGLVRWSLDAAQKARIAAERDCRPNARFIVLDPNGEYARAFRDLDARVFRVDPGAEAETLRVPAWLWNGGEWAAFTGAAPGTQRPVLFDALRRLRSGLGAPDRFETEVKGRIKRYRDRLRVLVQSGDHQQRGKREDAADVLLNIQKDFGDHAQRPECTDTALREALNLVASRGEEVENAARGRPKPDGGYWHNDSSEAALETLARALQEAANVAGLGEAPSVADEGTPIPFLVRELPDYVDALASDRSGRDIAQFVDTLSLRIRSLLSGGRLASVIQPDESPSITLEGWWSSL